MPNDKNKNHVSFWFWMFALFVMSVPCIGLVMIFVWAFTGENESRKNYFKALIVWGLIVAAISFGLMTLGLFPVIQAYIEQWMNRK